MKRLSLCALFILAMAGAGLSQDSQSNAPGVRGQVVDAENGVPLRRSRVSVSAGQSNTSAVFTDDRGRFELPIAPSPPYTLRISKAGYAAAVHTVQDADSASDLQVSLVKSAAIAGQIVTVHGAPAARVYVTARLLKPFGARLPDTSRFFTPTDNWGEYRLSGLPPGRYAITAARAPERRDAGTALEEQLFGPRADLVTADEAMVLDLEPGSERHNVRFTIAHSPEACWFTPKPPPADPTASGGISGRVTGASGEPLECAIVRLVGADGNARQVQADSQGRFSIDALAEGSYILEARQLDYVTLHFGQQHPSDVVVPVTIRDGEQRERIEIALPRGIAISGRVVDEHGEPLQGVLVMASPWRRAEGTPAGMTAASPAATDDRGVYRLIVWAPDTYLVVVEGAGAISGASGGAQGYAPIFYPGTPDPLAAQRLTIDTGLDATGIDIVFRPIPVAQVTGTVVDAQGLPFAGPVALSVSARSGAPGNSRSATADTSGRFVFRNVPPGEYVVKAPGPVGGIPPLFGARHVRVSDGDPPPVVVMVTPGAAVEGRISVEGVIDADLSGFGISAVSVDLDLSPGFGQNVNVTAGSRPDGSFRLNGVRGPNRLAITAMPACEGCYLKQASVESERVTDRVFDFGLDGRAYQNVNLVVSGAGAALSGQVTDEANRAVPVASVIVFSADPTLWYPGSPHVAVSRTEIDGAFAIRALPPGEYFAAALSRLPMLIRSNREALEQLSAVSRRVRLDEWDRERLQLRVIRQ
jgi:protocatechuate 3,4-dioxygenase beta subunit